jgi:hypothetical protein
LPRRLDLPDPFGPQETSDPAEADEVPKIEEYLGLDHSIPIVGIVGAAGEAHYVPSGELGRGTSLGRAFDGWLAFYDDVRNEITSDLLNRLCVIWLRTGSVVVKMPMRTPSPRRFHLMAEKAEDSILDAEIEAVARVRDIKPRDLAVI